MNENPFMSSPLRGLTRPTSTKKKGERRKEEKKGGGTQKKGEPLRNSCDVVCLHHS